MWCKSPLCSLHFTLVCCGHSHLLGSELVVAVKDQMGQFCSLENLIFTELPCDCVKYQSSRGLTNHNE